MSRFNLMGLIALTLGASLLLQGCERPPIESIQTGYRGTAMVQVNNPRIVAAIQAEQVAPESAPPAPDDGPRARDVYQNVQVLGDLSVAQFLRHMTSITAWVAPQQNCEYCHNLANLAEDSKYTKIVARRMLQMTQTVNVDWKQHTGETGVTCYTCHRGQPVPEQVWFQAEPAKAGALLGDDRGQNKAAASVGFSSLPYDPFSLYLADNKNIAPIRVYGPTALLAYGGEKWGTMQAEYSYGLMMHMSDGLGVNCTFCHNTANFQSWDGPPQRVNAWHGIRMVGAMNAEYITPLTDRFPAERLGPMGDVAKVNCSTCHQGWNKPLGGAQMAKDYIGLLSKGGLTAALPPPLSEADRSVLYFGVGSAVLQGAQAQGLAQLIVSMAANTSLKASVSGYHSAAGELAANQELAKQRAFTVRDSLLAAGVAEGRVVLEKPLQAEANLVGEDPAARRVEITLR